MKYNCLSNCSEIVILTFHQLPVSHRSGLKLNKKSSFFFHYSERRIIVIDLEMIESLAKTICEHVLFLFLFFASDILLTHDMIV